LLLAGCGTTSGIRISEQGVDFGFVPAPGDQVTADNPGGQGAVERAAFIVDAAPGNFQVQRVVPVSDDALLVTWQGTCVAGACLDGLGYWNDPTTLFLDDYVKPGPFTLHPSQHFSLAFRLRVPSSGTMGQLFLHCLYFRSVRFELGDGTEVTALPREGRAGNTAFITEVSKPGATCDRTGNYNAAPTPGVSPSSP
jgi:hypothetical protein